MKKCARAGVGVLALAVAVGLAGRAEAQTLATNFMTYQGKLQSGAQPYTGTADFTIRVYNGELGGSPIGLANCWDNVQVQDGLFTLTFNPGSVLDGRALWLEIDVREDATAGNGCTGAFTTLFPRQRITAAPLASALVLPASGSTTTSGPALSISNSSSASTAVALQGTCTNTGADTIAVQGVNQSTGTSAIGVYGRISTPTPGAASVGVMGAIPVSGTSDGTGVFGLHMGSGIAVRGTSNGGTGVAGSGSVGVSGLATGAGPNAIGVHGQSFDAAGTGVRGDHSAATGTAPGVFGTSNSTDVGAVGIRGVSIPSTAGIESAGVSGINQGTNDNGAGVRGFHFGSGAGVVGRSTAGVGVKGEVLDATASTIAVQGTNGSNGSSAMGVAGTMTAASPGVFASGVYGAVTSTTSANGTGVNGVHFGPGVGVRGDSGGGVAVQGQGLTMGVHGYVTSSATPNTIGVYGVNSNVSGIGVKGEHFANTGTAPGVWGLTTSVSSNATGVLGEVGTTNGGAFSAGVRAVNNSTGGGGVGLFAQHNGSGYGVYATTTGATGYAGYFSGRVFISNNLQVGGALTKGSGAFKIDHPLDPQNKFLYHSFVESPDMMNIYNGVVTTDDKGYATVTMPEWFQALNQDFRYQLTVIDEADGEDFVMTKVVKPVADNRFTLRASKGGVRVSWQVTGIRHDAFARDQRIPTEVLKSESERGMFLYPQGFGFGDERRIGRAPVDSVPRQ